jgi:hypothetical protein
MAEYQVLGEGWKTIACEPAPVHEALDLSEEMFVILSVFGATASQWTRAPSFTRFLDHI